MIGHQRDRVPWWMSYAESTRGVLPRNRPNSTCDEDDTLPFAFDRPHPDVYVIRPRLFSKADFENASETEVRRSGMVPFVGPFHGHAISYGGHTGNKATSPLFRQRL